MHTHSGIVQLGYLVKDVEQAAREWIALLGAGPFLLTPQVTLEYIHRGEPAVVVASGALGQAGVVQIELIQQDSQGPSLYRDTIPEGAEGLHHVAVVVDDLDVEVRRMEAVGVSVAAWIEYGGMRVAHMDTVSRLGFMVELIERSRACDALFEMSRNAATGWDGQDPCRAI